MYSTQVGSIKQGCEGAGPVYELIDIELNLAEWESEKSQMGQESQGSQGSQFYLSFRQSTPSFAPWELTTRPFFPPKPWCEGCLLPAVWRFGHKLAAGLLNEPESNQFISYGQPAGKKKKTFRTLLEQWCISTCFCHAFHLQSCRA